ncbi:FAD/NAD(P)-binding domain-containing protein [Ramaria rubella]|nr:FAD/NAD(P)-binding domain-containing protein [Ramaria rubella]
MFLQVPTQVEVLVVGAGPVGLVSAITLAKLGMDVAIVDAASTSQNGSHANVVHSHTLEVLDSIGLAEPLIQAGLRTDTFVFNGKTNKLLEIDLLLHDVTKFPFSIIIPQHEVERILRERLASDGIHIFRNKTVVGFRQADSGVEVLFGDGSVTRTLYIVGADGSHFTVRHLSGIEFKDPYTGVSYDDKDVSPSLHLVLADIHLQEPLPASVPRNRMSPWRIGFAIPIGYTDAPHIRTLEYMQQQLDERNPWGAGAGVTISSIEASSRYRVRAAVASKYFHKVGNANILLAGDAAHVHAPVGGQGMNLGICDAVAAAHAIQSHSDSRVKDGESDSDVVLMQYADLRRKIGVRVVGMTSGFASVINASVGWRRPIRNVVLAIINHLPFLQLLVAMRVSGLANRIA